MGLRKLLGKLFPNSWIIQNKLGGFLARFWDSYFPDSLGVKNELGGVSARASWPAPRAAILNSLAVIGNHLGQLFPTCCGCQKFGPGASWQAARTVLSQTPWLSQICSTLLGGFLGQLFCRLPSCQKYWAASEKRAASSASEGSGPILDTRLDSSFLLAPAQVLPSMITNA